MSDFPYMTDDNSSEAFMTGCMDRGFTCSRIYLDSCFEVRNTTSVDCLISIDQDTPCTQTSLLYTRSDEHPID